MVNYQVGNSSCNASNSIANQQQCSSNITNPISNDSRPQRTEFASKELAAASRANAFAQINMNKKLKT